MTSKSLYKNLFFSFLTLIFLFFLWLKYLDFYTKHDKYIKVPNFNGIHINSLDSIMDEFNLRYTIIDSIFDKSKRRGIVVNQDPEAKSYVKENRKIYLTINFLKNRKVIFPDIYDLTLRQAVRVLKRNGLKVGNLEYRKDIATNKVLGFKINGISIVSGQSLFHGTVIDLVLGRAIIKEEVTIPDLIGLTSIEANIIIKSTSLNVGKEFYRNNVTDSSNAKVYMQFPSPNDQSIISLGSSVDLYLEN